MMMGIVDVHTLKAQVEIRQDRPTGQAFLSDCLPVLSTRPRCFFPQGLSHPAKLTFAGLKLYDLPIEYDSSAWMREVDTVHWQANSLQIDPVIVKSGSTKPQ
jgi:hypothetical protein